MTVVRGADRRVGRAQSRSHVSISIVTSPELTSFALNLSFLFSAYHVSASRMCAFPSRLVVGVLGHTVLEPRASVFKASNLTSYFEKNARTNL